MKVGSLFSGIGGLELGLERAGMETIWQSEIDPYASKVLRKHWPNVPNLRDVTQIDWSQVERPDLVCGGFPCQPVSIAGGSHRAGHDDNRWLWPEYFRCLRYLRPRYALVENTTGLFSLGFGRVLADLASLGFDAEWSVVSACSVGAPHTRERVFLVAYPSGKRRGAWTHDTGAVPGGRALHSFERPTWWTSEPPVGRVANGIPSRMDRLRCLGNAVVPQVAEVVGRWIMAQERQAA